LLECRVAIESGVTDRLEAHPKLPQEAGLASTATSTATSDEDNNDASAATITLG
jgi:hypothetical protein